MIIMREESNQADPTQKIVSYSSLAQGQLIWKNLCNICERYDRQERRSLNYYIEFYKPPCGTICSTEI